jgi:uncharacterized phage protein (TIGR02218 family)
VITTPAALQTFFNSRPQSMFCADLFTIALRVSPYAPVGQVLRYTSSLYPVNIGGVVWLPGPPNFERGDTTIEVGLKSNDTTVGVSFDQTTLINGVPIAQVIRQGAWNYALVSIDRAYAPAPFAPWIGSLARFRGTASTFSDIGETSVSMRVKSLVEMLDSDFPRNSIMASCNKILYSPDCGANRTAVRKTGHFISGTVNNIVVAYDQSTGVQFAGGSFTWTSGIMSGLTYWIRQSAPGGMLSFATPLLAVPNSGDTFTLAPGCDKTQATCTGVFNNLANYGGYPFVPQPETVY